MHYVCADIHGQYEMYLEMLKKIDFGPSDRLYIIGDAVDRGPDPIPLLLDIMRRENVTFMIGNHEHMMIRALRGDSLSMADWVMNGGEVTLDQYEDLSRLQQNKYLQWLGKYPLFRTRQETLLQWLEKCPIVIPDIKVGGKTFYLAHACHTRYREKDILRYCDAGIENIEQVVWSRDYRHPDPAYIQLVYGNLYSQSPETTFIIGHTPVYFCSYGRISEDAHPRISYAMDGRVCNIDCGCAGGYTLGCLRLEDNAEFYIDRKPFKRKKRNVVTIK